MKLLTQDGCVEDLRVLKECLEENGIPAFIQGEETARMIVPLFLLGPTLWIYIDEQLDDAVQLIQNPEHMVRIRVDVEEFYRLQPSERVQRKALNKVMMQVVLFLAALMVGIYLIIRYLQGLST